MTPTLKSLAWVILLSASVLGLFWNLGFHHVTDVNEGLRLIPALEMAETGDWIVPRVDGIPYLKKPPLINWLGAAGFSICDCRLLAAGRLPTALSAFALILLLAFIVSRHRPDPAGPLAGLVLAGTYYFLDKAQKACIDPVLTLVLFAGVYLFWLALASHARGRVWKILFAGLLFGLAALLKGPVFIPFLVAAAAAARITARPSWARLLGTSAAVCSAAIFLILPWLFLLAKTTGWPALWSTIQEESITRLASATPINSGPFYYYLYRLPGAFAPWALLLLFWCSSRVRRHLRDEPVPFFRFSRWYLLVSLGLFSLIAGKEVEYLMPLFPFLAAECGLILDLLCRSETTMKIEQRLVVMFVAVLGVGCTAAGVQMLQSSAGNWARDSGSSIPLYITAAVLFFVAVMIHGMGIRRGAFILALFTIVIFEVSFRDMIKTRENALSTSSRAAEAAVERAAQANLRLYRTYRHEQLSAHRIWHWRDISSPLPMPGEPLEERLAAAAPCVIMAPGEMIEVLAAIPGTNVHWPAGGKSGYPPYLVTIIGEERSTEENPTGNQNEATTKGESP